MNELKSDNYGLLVVISGPSGVGKDTVLNKLRLSHPDYHFAITVTTRQKRSEEIDGTHYAFVDQTAFMSMIDNNEFMEWSEVYGNLYGVPMSSVKDALSQGKDVILKIDVQGADKMRAICPEALFLFLAPPDMEKLKDRLLGRGSDSQNDTTLRLEEARKELEQASLYDHIVVNEENNVPRTVAKINNIIISEKNRSPARKMFTEI